MNNLITYLIIAFGLIVFLFIGVIWATVIKGAFPTIKRIWLPSKQDNLKLNEVGKNLLKNYSCNYCGAKLGQNADVSPSGDTKCQYCNKWFNIHNKA